jgi:hypothetical protein
MDELRKLPLEFIGTGEVSKFNFKQLEETDAAYLYEVSTEEGSKHYEVFKKIVNKGFDFETKQALDYSVEQYPKSRNFGSWAWSYTNYDKAVAKLNTLEVNNG